MEHKFNPLPLLATIVGLSLVLPGTLHAQEVLEKEAISATIIEQNTNTIDNGTTTTTKVPPRVTLTTASLLKDLALSEENAGNWTNSTFPPGAKLDFNGSGFEVDKGTNELVDVSDALAFTQIGQNTIGNGTYSDANGPNTPPYTQTDYYIGTLTYTGVEYSFTVTGLTKLTAVATNPRVKTGNFTESATFSLQDGTGEGSITPANGNTTPIVLTGFTMTASGSVLANDGMGTD
jgi:hypothetical protein